MDLCGVFVYACRIRATVSTTLKQDMIVNGMAQQQLNQLRKYAVDLRLKKTPLKRIRPKTGLSTPTIINAYRSFLESDWKAVPTENRGRPESHQQPPIDIDAVIKLLINTTPEAAFKTQKLWSIATAQLFIKEQSNCEYSGKRIVRILQQQAFIPAPSKTKNSDSKPCINTRFQTVNPKDNNKIKKLIGGIQQVSLPHDEKHPGKKPTVYLIFVRDLRRKLYCFCSDKLPRQELIIEFFERLTKPLPTPIQLSIKSYPLDRYPLITNGLNAQPSFLLSTFMDESKHGNNPRTATKYAKQPFSP